MRSRSPVEIALALVAILIRERTVKQAALALELGLASRTIVKYLTAFYEHGAPIESEQEHPNVFWSIRPFWVPGGVVLPKHVADAILHMLPLLPQTPERDDALDALRAGRRGAPDARAVVVAAPAAEGELTHLVLVEDAALERFVLRVRHVGSGPLAGIARHVSPIRILAAPPIRVIAVCHKTGILESFRLDALVEARRDPIEAYRPADPAALEALLLTATLAGGAAEPANEIHPRAA